MERNSVGKTPAQALAEAVRAWEGAPMHVKAMAGAYVGPMLQVLGALVGAVDGLQAAQSLHEGGASHGN